MIADRTYKETWHAVHFIVTLLTGGFWIPVWIYCTLSNNDHNRRVMFERGQ